MNETPAAKQSFRAIVADTAKALRQVMADRATRRPLLSSASFMAVFATLKHYIQPILVTSGAAMLAGWGVPEKERPLQCKVLIGIMYAVFYLCSAVGTANSHRLKCLFRTEKMAMDALFNVIV